MGGHLGVDLAVALRRPRCHQSGTRPRGDLPSAAVRVDGVEPRRAEGPLLGGRLRSLRRSVRDLRVVQLHALERSARGGARDRHPVFAGADPPDRRRRRRAGDTGDLRLARRPPLSAGELRSRRGRRPDRARRCRPPGGATGSGGRPRSGTEFACCGCRSRRPACRRGSGRRCGCATWGATRRRARASRAR
jgi:hypothetical protein